MKPRDWVAKALQFKIFHGKAVPSKKAYKRRPKHKHKGEI